MIYFVETNRNGWSVAYYIRNNINYIEKKKNPEEIENIFFEISLPKTKQMVFGIIYRLLSNNNFLEILSKSFPSIDTDAKEKYFLVDFNKKQKTKNNKYL